ncbi:MAG: hypothetical protein JWL86_3478 [Rhizobium sp.]|nr:hypothetical protein [Rhizobium sp.]
MREELGRIIRGETEEIWTATNDDDGRLIVQYERLLVAGEGTEVAYLSPREVYGSDAPRPIKDKLLARVLFADTHSRLAMSDDGGLIGRPSH